MKLDKYDRMFIAFMFVIVTIFSIGSCFATEEQTEDIEVSIASGIVFDGTKNYFYSSTGNTGYVALDSHYIYTIENNLTNYTINIGFSSEVPSVNGVVDWVGTVTSGNSYSFIPTNEYLYFDYAWYHSGITIKREKIAGQESAVNDLVENVGFNQLWGVFENGIDFVGVVVLVAFGLFLVFLLIKKITKGKSDF